MEAQSQGITDADVVKLGTGYYCIYGDHEHVQVTPDRAGGNPVFYTANAGVDGAQFCSGTWIEVMKHETDGDFVQAYHGFYVLLY